MSSDNQNDETKQNNTTTKTNEAKESSQVVRNPDTKQKHNSGNHFPIIIAFVIILVGCVTGIIIAFSSNKNTPVNLDNISPVTLENLCVKNNGYFRKEDETLVNGTIEATSITYTCTNTEDNKSNFRITIASQDYTTIMQDISNQNDYYKTAYQDFIGKPGGYVKYLFNSPNKESSPTITTITDTPEYYKGKMQITIDDKTIDGDYYVAYKNILINTTNEDVLNELGANR